jgi:hypothetical protein
MLEMPGGHQTEAVLQQSAVDAGGILEPAAVVVVVAQTDSGVGLDEHADPTGGEEHVRADGATEEHVVIGVEEVFCQTRNMVQLALDSLRVMGGQDTWIGEELFAGHERDSRIVGKPVRTIGIGCDEDPSDPRRVHVDGP